VRYLFGVVLLSLELGGAFGVGSVEGIAVSSGEIQVSMSVEVAGIPSSVVVHFVDPGDDQTTVSLVGRGEGRFSATATVERADLVVVFEAVWADGSSELSRPVTLTELGLDSSILLDGNGAVTDEETELTLDATTERWGWAAVALGATALALLAWWALADYPKRSRADEVDEPSGQA
jgi:hypothetical protein